jgi:hypothetical protein
MSPWEEEHARRVLERIGRAQARAKQASARHDEAMRHAEAMTNPGDRAFHEREAAQHLDACHRHEEAVEIQMMHLRHLFRTEDAFQEWLSTHDADLDGTESASE